MNASGLIAKLQALMLERGIDPEVLAQSHGCCSHGHEIEKVEFGTTEDSGAIIIRV